MAVNCPGTGDSHLWPQRKRRTAERDLVAARGADNTGVPMRLVAWGGGGRGRRSRAAVAGKRPSLGLIRPAQARMARGRTAIWRSISLIGDTHGADGAAGATKTLVLFVNMSASPT